MCDARAVFATRPRFPMADEVVNDWPDRYLADGRRRARAARRGLRADPRHQVRRARDRVGALRHAGRLHRRDGLAAHAREARSCGSAKPGSSDAEIDRIMSPIGLDLGARTPEETAIADLRRDHRPPHRSPRAVPPRRHRPDSLTSGLGSVGEFERPDAVREAWRRTPRVPDDRQRVTRRARHFGRVRPDRLGRRRAVDGAFPPAARGDGPPDSL